MLAFGAYQPGSSCIHQLNAQVKIILACAFSICALEVGDWIALGALCLAVFVCYCLARLTLREAMAGVSPLAILLLFTVAAHVVVPVENGSIAYPIAQAGSMGFEQAVRIGSSVALTLDGFVVGLFFSLRITVVICACALLTFTTSQVEVTNALRRFLKPLAIVRLPIDDICSVVSVSLRFVPTVAQEFSGLKRARSARGALFEGQGPLNAIKAWSTVIVPLFVALFRRADILARAMDARCYGAGLRGSLDADAVSPTEVLVCFAAIACFVAIVVLL